MRKTVLITGATSGIGQASTELFAANGYEVFATYRSPEHRARLAAIAHVHPIQLDVTDREQLAEAVEAVTEATGDDGLYALINNAGITYSAPFEYADEARAREVMDVNLMAPFRITQAFIPLLVKHNKRNEIKSRVVNIASWAGLMSAPFIPFYNASKFAIIGLTESMYYDLGLLDIQVALAVPGITKTALLEKTTGDGTETIDAMPAEGQARYRGLFDHYATMSASSNDMAMLSTPERVAGKLLRIVNKRKPRYKNNLAIDAALIDNVMTRLPRSVRVAMNNRMYQLDKHPAAQTA